MNNSGILILNNAPPEDELTLIVSGIGRCGTSMIAGIMHTLGLNLGEFEPTVYEDTHMHFALGNFYHEARYKIIAYRNEHFAKWGFKFPGIQNHIFAPELKAHFRNPRMILMQRDNAAVAARLLQSDGAIFKNASSALYHAANQQLRLLEFAQLSRCPTAVLSYEKIIANPELYVKFLATFCGLQWSEDDIVKAVHTVVPNHPEYVSMFA